MISRQWITVKTTYTDPVLVTMSLLCIMAIGWKHQKWTRKYKCKPHLWHTLVNLIKFIEFGLVQMVPRTLLFKEKKITAPNQCAAPSFEWNRTTITTFPLNSNILNDLNLARRYGFAVAAKEQQQCFMGTGTLKIHHRHVKWADEFRAARATIYSRLPHYTS